MKSDLDPNPDPIAPHPQPDSSYNDVFGPSPKPPPNPCPSKGHCAHPQGFWRDQLPGAAFGMALGSPLGPYGSALVGQVGYHYGFQDFWNETFATKPAY